MADQFRELCAELVERLAALHKQSVTAPSNMVIELTNGRHPVPIGNDILAQDRLVGNLIARARAALSQQEGTFGDELQDAINSYDHAYRESAGMPHTGFGPAGCTEHHRAGLRAVLARWCRPAQLPAEALAARPLLEQVARMGDCIGANTVGEITAISDSARAWLQENPPGQPVAIEPRGCPAPGACGCVEPAPQSVADGEVGELVELIRQIALAWEPDARLLGNMTAGQLARTADLLEHHHPQPIPVSERLPGPGDCDAEGRCWWFCFECPGEHSYWILAKEVYCNPTFWRPFSSLPLPTPEPRP